MSNSSRSHSTLEHKNKHKNEHKILYNVNIRPVQTFCSDTLLPEIYHYSYRSRFLGVQCLEFDLFNVLSDRHKSALENKLTTIGIN